MIDKQKFFEGFKPWFKRVTGRALSARQVKAVDFLLDGFGWYALWKSDVRFAAYALATIAIETAWTFEPIVERGSRSYFDRYDPEHNPKKAKALGNTKKGDGYLFRGRGYVQITGRANYRKFELESDPEAALTPSVSFEAMTDGMHFGWFTGKKLSDYINSTKTDYKGARRIINGQDRAAEIAGYAQDIENILKLSAAASDRPVNEESEAKINNPITEPATQPSDQQQKPLLDRVSAPLINIKSKFDAIGVDPKDVGKSSVFTTLVTKVGGWVLLAAGIVSDHAIWFVVGGILIIAAIWYWNSARNRAQARRLS